MKVFYFDCALFHVYGYLEDNEIIYYIFSNGYRNFSTNHEGRLGFAYQDPIRFEFKPNDKVKNFISKFDLDIKEITYFNSVKDMHSYIEDIFNNIRDYYIFI